MSISNTKNNRQIPKTRDICSDKMYSDILYAYLQYYSQWDGNMDEPRYLNKNVIKYTKIAKDLNWSRQTVAKRFKGLIGLNLIEETEDKIILKRRDSNLMMLIPLNTLVFFMNALSPNALSVYVYILTCYFPLKEDFIFSFEAAKEFIGLSLNTRSNNHIIKDILVALSNQGLVDYEQVVERDGDDVKINYRILEVRTYSKKTDWRVTEDETIKNDAEKNQK